MAGAESELRRRFVAGMSHAPCTVNVVTTDGPAGRFGVTVSAMSSVSADAEKPTLLVCVNALSASAQPILANGVFCVNILRDDQTYIADCFAGRSKPVEGDRFSCARWTTQKTGAPRLLNPLVAFDCRLVLSEKVGTHFVLIGAVEDVHYDEPGTALIYANRTYGTALRFGAGRARERGAEEIKVGAFHTFAPYVVPEIIKRVSERGQPCDCRLVEGDQRYLVEGLKCGDIDIALIYDWDLGPDIVQEKLVGHRPYILLAESNPLAGRSSLSLSEVANEPLILLNAPPSATFFLSLFQDRGLTPNVRLQSASFEMVRGLVACGLGYSVLVTQPANATSYDGRSLTTRPIRDEIPPTYMSIAYRKQWRPSSAAGVFLATCREVLRSRPIPA